MIDDVLVIGGGISGLATALELHERGFGVRVLERQTRLGGNAISERFDGFLMEHGPTTLNAAFPKAMQRLEELDLRDSAVNLGPGVRKRYLRDQNGLHGVSTHRFGFFLSDYLSWQAKLSLLAEIARPRRTTNDEETIHAFASRRFGTEFADRIIEPMAAGIFMGDSRDLSISGAFPKLVELEHRFGSILRGVIAARRGNEPGRQLFSWPGGIATLPRTMAARLEDHVTTGVTVTRIERSANGFAVTTAAHGTLRSRSVVLAVQPHVAATLLDRLDPDSARALNEIAAPAVSVVFLGYKKEQVAHSLDGLGFLSTKAPGQLISGAQFCSTMFDGRAPEGYISISCYAGGARNPKVATMREPELIGAVTGELSGLLGISGDPAVCRTRHWPRGLPQYSIGHSARQAVIETANQRVPGLTLAGNFISGVSVTSCLERAAVAARTVASDLNNPIPGPRPSAAIQ